MAFRQELEKAYRINPDYLGSHFATPAPQPDVFGRKQVSPVEIQRGIEIARENQVIFAQKQQGKKRRR